MEPQDRFLLSPFQPFYCVNFLKQNFCHFLSPAIVVQIQTQQGGNQLLPQQDIYLQIERRYGFTIPVEYRYMYEKGWFNAELGIIYGGPNYMWVNDMKWLTPNEIRDYTRLDEWTKPGFAPFAISAGGDHWCWYTPASTNGVAPVVFCPRDYYVGEFYAPNFIGSLYRQMLEYVIYCDPEEETDIRAHLKRWQECFAPLFPARWIETLSRLHDTPIAIRDITGSGEHWKPSLLSSEDCHAIVRRDLAFDELDKQIRWMRDELWSKNAP